MLLGEMQHSLDNKGRLIVPSKFRNDLGDKFIVTKGLDACLTAYPLSEWKKFEEKLSTLPISDKDARKFVRFFLSGAAECEPDSQGRVIIPQNLREYAKLEKDVISIGVNSRVEIWNKDSWNNYNADENFIDNELAERMAELGI